MQQLKNLFTFFSDITLQRRMLIGLAKNDFKAKFASSLLGVTWAFVQPLVTILVFWFVFQMGFKNPPVNNVPFIVWFAPAYLVWSFFSETLMAGTNCLLEYHYLVKKVHFRVSMIPLVKIISSAFVHLAFVVFILLMLILNHVSVTIYAIQVVYYFGCTVFLLIGLCWLLSAVSPFLKDTSSIVSVFVQIGFWITPIAWNPNEMEITVQNILKINPMFYICRGYRDCFIDHVWFWERGGEGVYFWFLAAGLFIAGAYVFQKLRPQFADVL